MGHRGADATSSVLKESFWWPGCDTAVKELVRGCLHCLVTRSGQIIPRPLGSAIHGSRPNEVLHMDYLYMGAGRDGMVYNLILRDDF